MVSKSFKITTKPLDTQAELAVLSIDSAGAVVTFEGRVRNHNEGKAVAALYYEAYERLAESCAETIIQEALQKFGVEKIIACHRVGDLKIGEPAVFVAVASAHRKEAFQACQYVIDEIKHRLPIWKKETYKDGSHEWVNCKTCSNHTEATEIPEPAGSTISK